MRDTLFLRRKAGEIGPVFTEHHTGGLHAERVDGRQVDATHPIERVPQRIVPALFDRAGFRGLCWRRSGAVPAVRPRHLRELPQNFLLILPNPLGDRVEHL
jgi:hypothetical protein